MFEFINNGTKVEIHWFAAILQILAIYIIITVITHIRIKKALSSFVEGNSDDKLIKKCESLKRQFRFHTNKNIYNLFCCILAALWLSRGQKHNFFAHINDINCISADTRNRLYILLLAYVSGKNYVDLLNECKETEDGKRYTENTVLVLYGKYGISEFDVKNCIEGADFDLNNQLVIREFEELLLKLKA